MQRNPALREYLRSQPAPVIPVPRNPSILDWLERSGRMIQREANETLGYDEEEQEISELMDGGDNSFDDDDDDVLDLDDD
jgi:hypothetical protein